MKASVLNEYGASSHPKLAEIPEPRHGVGEVKVKLAAAGLNPIDWKLRSGDYKAFMPIQFPYSRGCITRPRFFSWVPNSLTCKHGSNG